MRSSIFNRAPFAGLAPIFFFVTKCSFACCGCTIWYCPIYANQEKARGGSTIKLALFTVSWGSRRILHQEQNGPRGKQQDGIGAVYWPPPNQLHHTPATTERGTFCAGVKIRFVCLPYDPICEYYINIVFLVCIVKIFGGPSQFYSNLHHANKLGDVVNRNCYHGCVVWFPPLPFYFIYRSSGRTQPIHYI